MRTVTYGAASSLDGFIARKDHSVDWLKWSDDVAAISSRYLKSVDTVLMGRKTYDVAVRVGTASYPGLKTYVFSRTLEKLSDSAVQLCRDDVAKVVRKLKAQDGKGICVMGGGELAQSLIADGVVDEIGLNVHPILLGAGVPFFRDPGRRVQLELTESRVLHGGCVLMSYRVAAPKPKARRSRRAVASTAA